MVTHQPSSPNAEHTILAPQVSQLVRDRIHELAHFGDMVVFAGHPTVDFIGGRGDDEQHRGDPAHGQVVLTPGTGENVECQEKHHEYDARVGDQVRRRVPSVEQR